MSYISKIDPETAGEKEKEVIRDHLAQGYRLTNEKLTLLHNAEAFKAIEDSSYTLDRELQRLIGKRAGDFFEYAISEENDCLVCSTYFRKLLKDNGIDFDNFQFTKKEELLISFGRALAKDPKNIPDEIYTELKEEFTDESVFEKTDLSHSLQNTEFIDKLVWYFSESSIVDESVFRERFENGLLSKKILKELDYTSILDINDRFDIKKYCDINYNENISLYSKVSWNIEVEYYSLSDIDSEKLKFIYNKIIHRMEKRKNELIQDN